MTCSLICLLLIGPSSCESVSAVNEHQDRDLERTSQQVSMGDSAVKEAFGNCKLYIRLPVSIHEINKLLNLVDLASGPRKNAATKLSL